jgi:hypothetical protein
MINILNSLMSYLLLLVIIVAVAGVAMTIGITMAKKKQAKGAANHDDGKA